MSLDSPYGDSGSVGVDSVTTAEDGVPYTPAEDENTSRPTPATAMASSRDRVPSTFC